MTPGPVELHYLTGTGNTYRVAEWIAEDAREAGAPVGLVRIGRQTERSEAAAVPPALLGVLAPTHGFTAPWSAIKHVARLKGVRGVSVFVVAARAGWGWTWLRLPGFEGTNSWLLAGLLAAKGAHVVGVTGVDMPSNWTAVHPGLRPANVDDIVGRARARVRAFAGALLDGRRVYRGWISLSFGLVLAPISVGYLLVGRPLLGKLFFADERCTSCGRCAKHCPSKAIRMLGEPARPYWTLRCECCMRCMNVCPEQSVQAAQLGAAGMVVVATAIGVPVGIVLALTRILRIGMAGTLVGQAVSWAAMLAAWSALYAVVWWLLRFAPVAWLLGHTTFTRIYRRYHEPGTDLRRV